MTSFPIAKVEDVPPGSMVGAEVEGERILVANIKGHFYAMRATCNHMNGPLDKGTIEGSIITCPLHKSRWDVITGKLVWFPRLLPPEPIYSVTISGDNILVEK